MRLLVMLYNRLQVPATDVADRFLHLEVHR